MHDLSMTFVVNVGASTSGLNWAAPPFLGCTRRDYSSDEEDAPPPNRPVWGQLPEDAPSNRLVNSPPRVAEPEPDLVPIRVDDDDDALGDFEQFLEQQRASPTPSNGSVGRSPRRKKARGRSSSARQYLDNEVAASSGSSDESDDENEYDLNDSFIDDSVSEGEF